MIDVLKIEVLQNNSISNWHINLTIEKMAAPFSFIQENNYWNFLLWHEEDITRIPTIEPEKMVKAKRNIDKYNQARNDTMEKIDEWIAFQLNINKAAELHSETPGMMIDRLSILRLKYFHTKTEVERIDVSEQHILKCTQRLAILEEQIKDLSGCLEKVLKKLQAGELNFKIYRQLKMYNDPELNPQLYNTDDN